MMVNRDDVLMTVNGDYTSLMVNGDDCIVDG